MSERKQSSFVKVLELLRNKETRDDVKIIDCSYTQASDADLLALLEQLTTAPHHVESLFLGGNLLTNKSVHPLAKYLATSKSIHTVDLSDNQGTLFVVCILTHAHQINIKIYCS
jgi:hypothetical protein